MSPRERVIVTGASRGIGLGIAGSLLATGYAVTAVARTSSEALDALADEHTDAFEFVAADIAAPDDRRRLMRQVAGHGDLHGLVNNAGVAVDGLLIRQRSEDMSRMIDINLTAPIELTRAVARQLVRRRAGRIIGVSSIVATRGSSGLAVYAATKAAMEGFTRSLARELGPRNITVNAVAPGFIDTDMTTGLDDAQRGRIARRAALAEPLTTGDVASVVAFLLSPQARMITGAVIPVDGGAGL